MKKLVEKQLKEILQLQREVEHLRTEKQHLSKVEIDDLKNERAGLLKLCEDLEKQVKDGHNSLEDALDKIGQLEMELGEKEKEIEEIRSRITEIAILFEKKEIKQRYSFEVLCDFIYDKSQRLFQKYESVQKENKCLHDEKSSHFQRRLEGLEVENDALKETVIQMNIIVKEFIPRLSTLLGKKERGIRITGIEGGGFEQIRQVLEQVDSAFAGAIKENKHLKERLEELLQ